MAITLEEKKVVFFVFLLLLKCEIVRNPKIDRHDKLQCQVMHFIDCFAPSLSAI